MDATLAALADPTRRGIVDRLRRGPATAGELGDGLTISQPAVSRHLRVLREAGIVTATSEGRARVYRLDPDPLAELDTWLADYRALWTHRLDALATEIARGKRARRTAQEQP